MTIIMKVHILFIACFSRAPKTVFSLQENFMLLFVCKTDFLKASQPVKLLICTRV